MKTRLTVLALALAALTTSARGADDAGTIAANFLRLEVGAASTAQGGAFTGRSGGVEAFAYNPAGLDGLDGTEIMFQHNSDLLDVSEEYLAVAHSLSRFDVAGSIAYLDGGDQTRRTISNPNGAGLASFHNTAIMVAIGASSTFANSFSAGATVKVFQENLDSAHRGGVAMDIGAHYTHSHLFEAGIAVRNLGPDVSADAGAEPLPLEGAIGASTLVWRDRVRLSGELALPRNQDLDYKAGVEARPLEGLALRAGYDSRIDLGSGLSAGFGVRINRFVFDYAWVDHGAAGGAHRVALTAGF